MAVPPRRADAVGEREGAPGDALLPAVALSPAVGALEGEGEYVGAGAVREGVSCGDAVGVAAPAEKLPSLSMPRAMARRMAGPATAHNEQGPRPGEGARAARWPEPGQMLPTAGFSEHIASMDASTKLLRSAMVILWSAKVTSRKVYGSTSPGNFITATMSNRMRPPVW